VKDSEWIADLVRHGLIRKSFVPPPAIRELRELVRYRTTVVQSRTAQRNRLLAQLETANVKLASVVADVFGKSGMLMVRALVDGNTDFASIAELAIGKLRPKRKELALALKGRIEEHHRFLLRMELEMLDTLELQLARLDERIEEVVSPYREARDRLKQIPGVDTVVANAILGEIGADMSAFPNAQHLASWAGVCPGNNESAGKRRGTKARKGNAHLRAMLVQAAMAGARKKGTYVRDKYHRLKARRGAKRAALAVAHKILVAAYHMLNRQVGYAELGEAYLDHQSKRRVIRGLVRRVERLGYRVTVEEITA
jgi:transposase